MRWDRTGHGVSIRSGHFSDYLVLLQVRVLTEAANVAIRLLSLIVALGAVACMCVLLSGGHLLFRPQVFATQ